jgi:hypothetical protein
VQLPTAKSRLIAYFLKKCEFLEGALNPRFQALRNHIDGLQSDGPLLARIPDSFPISHDKDPLSDQMAQHFLENSDPWRYGCGSSEVAEFFDAWSSVMNLEATAEIGRAK